VVALLVVYADMKEQFMAYSLYCVEGFFSEVALGLA